jgi:hypothetical protein
MKTLSALLIAAAALGGCAIVPYEPAPVVYAAPRPAVVVAPRPCYYGGYYGYRHRYWR